MKKLIFLLSILFISCHDTIDYKEVIEVKTGDTRGEVEQVFGEPIYYQSINDSTYFFRYVYDNPGNGIDMAMEIVYQNGKVKSKETKFL